MARLIPESAGMVSKGQAIFIASYLTILLIHIVAGVIQSPDVLFWTKPLLLTMLSVYFFYSTRFSRAEPFRIFVILALILSLLGDCFLMMRGENYFILGLGSFLLAHIFYIIAFIRSSLPGLGNFLRFWPVILVTLGYSAYYFSILEPYLGNLKLPVLFYILVITLMFITAVNRRRPTSKSDFWLILFGALAFMASDSFLAWNKFVKPIDSSHLLIMSTYGLAQLLITLGAIRYLTSVHITKE